MISHGIISAALFLCVGVLYDRTSSRMIKSFGGIVNYLPNFSLIFIIFVLGVLGLPGTTGFIGEFLVLLGAFKKINYLVAILASTGVVLCAAYMLWMAKRVEVLEKQIILCHKIKRHKLFRSYDLNRFMFSKFNFGFLSRTIA